MIIMKELYYERKKINKEVLAVTASTIVIGREFFSTINPKTWDWKIIGNNLPELESSSMSHIDIDDDEIEFYSFERVELDRLIGKSVDNNEDNICE